MQAPNPFIQAARAGRNELWRYLVTVIASSALLLLASGLVSLAAFVVVHVLPREAPSAPAYLSPAAILVIALAPFAGLILGLWVGMRWLRRRSLHSLIRPGGRFRWRPIWRECWSTRR